MNRAVYITVILFFVFLLAGGPGTLTTYIRGARSYEEYAFGTIAPFFGGFILIGAFGVFYAYRNRQTWRCLFGFLIAVTSYIGIEVLFQMVG